MKCSLSQTLSHFTLQQSVFPKRQYLQPALRVQLHYLPLYSSQSITYDNMSLFEQFTDFMLQTLKIVSAWLHNTKQNFVGNFCLHASSYLFTVKREIQTFFPHPETVNLKRVKFQINQPTRCKIFLILLLDVLVKFNVGLLWSKLHSTRRGLFLLARWT